jgi:hypothetical protein
METLDGTVRLDALRFVGLARASIVFWTAGLWWLRTWWRSP